MKCLQNLATYHRKKHKIPVLAITGTNGKTTTKELITSVLSEKYNVTSTIGNFNNHIGVPLTLLRISNKTEIAVIEMGANHIGEISELCRIAQPNLGLITNIGKAHLEGFGSLDGVIKAKGELYKYLSDNKGVIFSNSDNQILNNLLQGINSECYGSNHEMDFFGQIINSDTFLKLEFFDRNDEILKNYIISTQLAGKYNFENVMAATKIGLYFNVEKENIVNAIENYKPSNNRSQILKTKKNTLIIDAYNANPTSMKIAIENFQIMKGNHKYLILGDMLELGKFSVYEHQDILKTVSAFCWDKVYLVGKEFASVSADSGTLNFNKVEDLKTHLQKHDINNSYILIKGSRGIKLEKVIEDL